jgi:hypothetical protein
MRITVDPDVELVLEFISSHVHTTKQIAVAAAVAQLMPILWPAETLNAGPLLPLHFEGQPSPLVTRARHPQAGDRAETPKRSTST